MFGILNCDKPSGKTSRDVVNRVQRLMRPAKIGHAGTLDPIATGVLLLAVGPAVRLVPYLQRMRKRYRATFEFGRESATLDREAEVTVLTEATVPTEAAIRAAIPALEGEILQRPPQYSAVKVGGRRAYQRARSGETVEVPPRNVFVHRIELLRYAYPQIELDIECGSGTYVRSLGRDLAQALGTGAVMTELVRTAVGPFTVDQSVALDRLDEAAVHRHLAPPLMAVGELEPIVLTPAEVEQIVHGRYLDREPVGDEMAAVDQAGRLRAILVPKGDGRIGPRRVFPVSGE